MNLISKNLTIENTKIATKKKRGVEGFRLDFEASNRVVEKNLQIPILFD